MAKGIVLIIGGLMLIGLPIPFGAVIGLALFLYGIYCTLVGFKRNIFELIDHIKGTPDRPSGQSYRDEARKACDRTAPKKDKYATPPWEE